jgi:hypothetical protein
MSFLQKRVVTDYGSSSPLSLTRHLTSAELMNRSTVLLFRWSGATAIKCREKENDRA